MFKIMFQCLFQVDLVFPSQDRLGLDKRQVIVVISFWREGKGFENWYFGEGFLGI